MFYSVISKSVKNANVKRKKNRPYDEGFVSKLKNLNPLTNYLTFSKVYYLLNNPNYKETRKLGRGVLFCEHLFCEPQKYFVASSFVATQSFVTADHKFTLYLN